MATSSEPLRMMPVAHFKQQENEGKIGLEFDKVNTFSVPCTMSWEDMVKGCAILKDFSLLPGFGFGPIEHSVQEKLTDFSNRVELNTDITSLAMESKDKKLIFDQAKVREAATKLQQHGINREDGAVFAIMTYQFMMVLSHANDSDSMSGTFQPEDGNLTLWRDDPYGLAAEFKNIIPKWNMFGESMVDIDELLSAVMEIHPPRLT